CHKPPDGVEPEPLHGLARDEAMAVVGWVEAAAKQADAHPWRRGRQGGDVRGLAPRDAPLQGRVCPVPRTRYLKLVNCSTPPGPRACILPVAMPISPPKPNSPP